PITYLNFYSSSSTPFIALFQFPYWSEPTGLYVLLSWYFLGINPNSSPTNSLTSYLTHSPFQPISFLIINACSISAYLYLVFDSFVVLVAVPVLNIILDSFFYLSFLLNHLVLVHLLLTY